MSGKGAMMAEDQENAGDFVLETERLVLRKLTEADAPFILDLLNEPSFIESIGDKGVRDLADARAYIRLGPIASYVRFGFGLYLTLRKEGDTPIGICGLLKRDTLENADVGFAFRPDYWCRGYGFEAASATVAFGKQQLGLDRIVAITSVNNVGSMRLLEKLGMRCERTLSLAPGEATVQLFA